MPGYSFRFPLRETFDLGEHKIIKRKRIIWLIFFLFLQTKPSFCRLFAWSHLDFSAIPVSKARLYLPQKNRFAFISVGTGVVYTGGKFAAGVIDPGGKLLPASLIPVANCHRYQQRWQKWWKNLPPVTLIPVANLPRVSLILAANFFTIFAGVVDTKICQFANISENFRKHSERS
jgi:hypothetical protein